jgi:hypothetical protein
LTLGLDPCRELDCRSAIPDGEVIVQDERGVSDFEALNSQSSEETPPLSSEHPDAQWLQPQLMARVRHLAGSKYFRHGTLRGLR